MTKKITVTNADKLVSHPIRIQIVTILAERPRMSPSELAKEIDQTLGTVAYHIRTMQDFGAIKLVSKKAVRGAIKHFYSLNENAKEPLRKAIERAREAQKSADKAFSALG